MLTKWGLFPEQASTMAAEAAFGDANILSVLPNHKVSMLRTYISAVGTLNEALQMHRSALAGSSHGVALGEGPLRENVLSNAAAVAANADVVRDELSLYFDEADYDHGEMERIEARVAELKEKVLMGDVALSKEE